MKSDSHRSVYIVRSKKRPTVEVDTEAGAAYIRFAKGKVATTEVQDEDGILVTFDLDKEGNVLGAELVGVQEFTLSSLLKKVPAFRNSIKTDARYVAAPKLQNA